MTKHFWKQSVANYVVLIPLLLIAYNGLGRSFTASPYCKPPNAGSGCSLGDEIISFKMGDFVNRDDSCGNHYKYFSSKTIEVRLDESYNIELINGKQSQGFGIWIDFNQDGDFDDKGEFVFNSQNNFQFGDTTIGTIDIPLSAKVGETRIRVRSFFVKNIGSGDQCVPVSFAGETEDYNIYINPIRYQKAYGDTADDKGHDVKVGKNNGFFLAGETNSYGQGKTDMLFVKTNQKGKTQWWRTFGGSKAEAGKALTRGSDSNYYLAGHTRSFGNGKEDFYLVKADSNGNKQWNKAFGGSQVDSLTAVESGNGKIYVAGVTNSFSLNSRSIYLAKIDTAGSPSWQKTFGQFSGKADIAHAIQLDSAGNLIVGGATKSYGAGGKDAFLMKVDTQGNFNWFKTYGGVNDDAGQSVSIQGDTSYYLTGYTQSYGGADKDGFFIGTDSAGKVTNYSVYGGKKEDQLKAVTTIGEDSLILSGFSKSFGKGSKSGFNIYTDNQGAVSWARTYGSVTGKESFVSNEALNDGRYVSIGTSDSFGIGREDLFVLVSDTSSKGCNQQVVNNASQKFSLNGVNHTVSKKVVSGTFQSGGKVNKPTGKTFLYCPVKADFGVTDTCIGNDTKFYDSTFAFPNQGYSWKWDFGDPTTSKDTATKQNPTYDYRDTGFFRVQLVVSNGIVTDTVSQFIKINGPVAEITPKDTIICPNDSVQLTTAKGYSQYRWSPASRVSDSTVSNPYAYPGKDTLTVKVTNANACTFTDSALVRERAIGKVPKADLQKVSVVQDSIVKGIFKGDSADAIFAYEISRQSNKGSFQTVKSRYTGKLDTTFRFRDTTNTRNDQLCYRVETLDSCLRRVSSDTFCLVQLAGKAGNLVNQVNWTPLKGFDSFKYHIQHLKNGQWQRLAKTSDTFYRDSGDLSCNKTEVYRVASVSIPGSDTSFSDTLHLTPFDTLAPPSPQLQFASGQTHGDVQVQWNWQPTTDQKYFEIWRDTGFGNFQRLDTVTYDSTYTDQTARPEDIQHQYYIIAGDSCAKGNRSAPSDTDRLMVPQATTGACQPQNFLSWNDYDDLPQGVDQYEIYRTQQQGTSNPFNLLTTNNEQQTTYLDTNLTETITYCYRIKALDTQSGYAAWSDSICKEPFDYPVPDTSEVIRTTVTKTGKANNGAVKVFWQRYPKNDTFARGYEIYHTTGQKPNNFQLIDRNSNLSDTTFTHKGINTSEDVHNYRVLVYNLCQDEGGFFNTHQPVNLSATNQNLSIKLDWVPYRGFPVQDYRVQKSIEGGPFRNIATLAGSDTSLVDSNIRCGIDYSYKVFADGRKAQETSVSDTIIRTGYDTIPADRPDLHRATVTATDNNQGEVELLFKGAPQANRKGYVISQEQGSTFKALDTIFTTQQTNLTYTANKVNTAQTSQTFYIQTIDSCGNTSLPSDTHRTIALSAKPKNAYVQLKWSAYQDWDDRTYQVQRRQSSAPWQTLITVDSSQLSYRDSGITCQEVYDYRIVGEEKGTSYQAWSNTDTAKAFESTPPAPPVISKVSVTQTGTSNGKVNITWNRSTSKDAAKYTIYRSPTGQNYQFLDTVASTSYTDQGLNTYNQPYYYRLKAIDSCDNLSDSFSTSHKTINLEANGSEEAVILSWNEYKGRAVSQYQVIRGSEVLYTVSGEQTFLRDKKVICDTFYNYQVRALMEGDTSIQALSNTDSAKATDNTPPRPIYLQRASVTRFNDVVELKWQASEAYDAKAYQIYRRNENTGDFSQIAQVKHPNTTYQDSFAINNREVCYFVKVKDACGNSSKSSNRGCIIQPEGSALDLENELSWPPYEKWQKGARTYEVFKQTGDSTYQSLARLDSSQRSYLDQDLRDSADQFCYYIRAEGFGEETFSRSTRICLEQSAIVHIPNTFSPGVTPNLNDQFGPEGLYIDNYEMQIYNRWGEQVFSTSTSEEWDGTYRGELVPQGVYHYQIVVRSEDGSRQTYSGVLTVIR